MGDRGVRDRSKACMGCGLLEPVVKFYKSNGSRCVACISIQGAEWRLSNRDRKKEADALYYAENREKCLLNMQVWAKENREQSNKIKREWAERNTDKVMATEERRREQKNAYTRAYAKTEVGKVSRKNAELRRQARKAGIVSDVSNLWLSELRVSSTICELCAEEMSFLLHWLAPKYPNLDHIIPLKVGGLHLRVNLRYICRDCNIRRPRDGRDVGPETEAFLRREFECAEVHVHA